MLVSRRVITSFPRWSLAGGARRERKLSVHQVHGVPRGTGGHSLYGQGSHGPLQLQRSAAGVQTHHLGRPGSEALPHLLHHQPLADRSTPSGLNQQPLCTRGGRW